MQSGIQREVIGKMVILRICLCTLPEKQKNFYNEIPVDETFYFCDCARMEEFCGY